jgi:lysophospholipase
MHEQSQISGNMYHSLFDGKRIRYAQYEPNLHPRGTILIAPGRREFIEKKHSEVGRPFVERGFRVFHFEWRGQGLSDRPLTGALRQRDHIPDFDLHLRDLRSFYDAIVQPHIVGPLLFCGHSMGAHLIARWLIEQPINVAGAILTAPMFAIANMPAHALAHGISWLEVKLGRGDNYAFGQHDYNQRDKDFDINPLTHDPTRFKIMERYFESIPDMTVGGVTWEWLQAATKSMDTAQMRGYLERLKTPTISITGGKDRVTPTVETSQYILRMPNAENVVIPGAWHDILNELDIYRLNAWHHIDKFLAQVIGG